MDCICVLIYPKLLFRDMAKRSPFSGITFLREAFAFARKQPAFHAVVLWLIFLPSMLLTLFGHLSTPGDTMEMPKLRAFLDANDPHMLSIALGFIAFQLWLWWGMASILVIGRRLIGNRAGRARTSFQTVAGEAAASVFPLFFTSILQMAGVLLWGLIPFVGGFVLALVFGGKEPFFAGISSAHAAILIVTVMVLSLPALIYSLRTSFFSVIVMAEENMRYRAALRQSKKVIRGRWIRTFLCMLVITVGSFFIPFILSFFADRIATASAPLTFGVDVVMNLVNSYATLLWLLSQTLLYGALRDAPEQVRL